MADLDPLVEVVVHEDGCPQDGSCCCDAAGVTVGAEDPALAPGAIRLDGDNIIRPWRYR